ncbi:4Fe-4S cluster-binding domain-containing protein, partial [Candidatus Bathyarchaeota archaeon]|nr:4Fe-4S cluster-binding domain-containing protein [Candidatus Bathyarchaeota archaeon]
MEGRMCKVVIKIQSCGCKDFEELRVAFGDMNNCQLKCPFCFTREQKPANDLLSNLSKKHLNNVKIIRFTGGEPLLSQVQIDGMIRELRKIENVKLPNLDLIVIQTNAIGIESRDIDGFQSLDLPILFEVSFKGTTI